MHQWLSAAITECEWCETPIDPVARGLLATVRERNAARLATRDWSWLRRQLDAMDMAIAKQLRKRW